MRAEQFTDPLTFHGEGPMWWPQHQRLFWVDMLGGDVLHCRSDATDITRRHVGKIAAFLRPRTNGGWVVATEREILLAESVDGEFMSTGEQWTDPGVRMNEGSGDPHGNLWFGSMAYDQAPGAAALYRMTPDGAASLVFDHVTISNGLDWHPDGVRAFYNDTPTRRIDTFDFDGTQVTDRRPFAEIQGDGNPDGLCVDSQGGVWTAVWGGSAVQRYGADGRLDEVVELPVPHVSACTFGGADLDELFITTSQQDVPPDQLGVSGAVFRAKVGVKGQPVRAFAG
jgi:sugar lactone lactonase YvrE